ncbi:hypothetical protein LSAT2_007667 [Lamellibrachia satsuma]|nr:hypothetical protein LSAT2_007667 [Lamellibrachia satsuma]
MQFDCCGLHSYHDFNTFSPEWDRIVTCYNETIVLKVPPTCCIRQPKEPLIDMAKMALLKFRDLKSCIKDANPNTTITEPCGTKPKEWVLNKYNELIRYAGAATAVQFATLVSMPAFYWILGGKVAAATASKSV